MKKHLTVALALLAILGLGAGLLPRTALANGAASTRNILLGAGAATYLIIQHNRVVHQREAAAAAQQAAVAQQRNDAWAAYHAAELSAHQEALANAELHKELAFEKSVVAQQQRQLAALHVGANFTHVVATTGSSHGSPQVVASDGIGWGTL
ncbi:MAG: hypothetical protein HKL91_01195 [Candidatus Eremiobacteraeota bacterium]|uniref:Uncharacterized protein n=1 Tax=mine drainage metagenome TaxID=410659 RepID=E6PFL7_9ZZZZ|nr:hypothetical protein [Candidatus Eremiobacteraeota bacterium]